MDDQSFSNGSSADSQRGTTSAGFSDTFSEVSEQVMKSLREIPGSSREIFTQVDRQVRANPWLNIGIVAAGGLFLGYLVGRSLSSDVHVEMDDTRDEE